MASDITQKGRIFVGERIIQSQSLIHVKVMETKEEEPKSESEGSFLIGAGVSLLFGLILVTIGFTFCFGPSCGVWGWNIIFIAFGIPVSASSLFLIGKSSDKQAMVRGAKTILIIGCVVALGVIIWFVNVLNSLGG
tara:strand:+ start:67 stop:474 length:408 start_codon:yes stop_codon:yes gene_type:complete